MNLWLKPLLVAALALSVPTTWALDAQQIFERVSPSIVVIKTADSLGSGVVYAVDYSGLTPSSTILTNCHVVKGSTQVTVERLGKKASATVKVCDAERDMAILTLGGVLPTLPVRTTPLKVGEPAFAVGAPQGLELSISQGIVSQLRPSPLGKDPMIQTTAAISQGSSGGGLFDGDGRLVGLTTMYHKEGQSLNFAVPISFVSVLKHSNTGRSPSNTIRPAPIPDSGLIANRYQVLGNGGVIKDIQTNLVWQRCSVGQAWDGKTCKGEAKVFTLDDAQQLARNGWRVPKVRELASIIYCSNGTQRLLDLQDGGVQIQYHCGDDEHSPTLQTVAFPRTKGNVYLTSSPYVGNSNFAWLVNFYDGFVDGYYRSYYYYVRLVR
jgi:hypothetical protein